MRIAVAGMSVLLALMSVRAPAQNVEGQQFARLSAQCAPSVHPQTLAAVVRQESGFNVLAIGVNGPRPRSVRARDRGHAVALATQLIASGASVDLGLGQINSANLRWLGLSVDDAFDACANLAAAARVLAENYRREAPSAPSAQAALDRALSRYNTGSPKRGLTNGYVASVRRKAGLAPAVAVMADAEPPNGQAAPPPSWDLFAMAKTAPQPWDAFAIYAIQQPDQERTAASRGVE